MATSTPTAPSAPQPADIKAAPITDPKAGSSPSQPQEPAKAANPFEAELAAKLGEDWKTLKPEIRAQLISAEQKSRDADKKYQLIAKIQKENDLTKNQMAQIVHAIKTDPMGVLSNPALGHDIHALAEKVVWEKIQNERLSPEQRRLKELESENARYKQAQEEFEKQRQAAEATERQKALREKFEKQIIETIQKHQLPNDPGVIWQMAYNMKLLKHLGKPVDMDWVAQKTRQDFSKWISGWMLGTPDEEIPKNVPDEFVKKLRKWDLARLRANGLAPKPGPKPALHPPVERKGNGKMTMTEWLDQRAQRLSR